VGWLGVFFGLLYPLTPNLVILGSFLLIKKRRDSSVELPPHSYLRIYVQDETAVRA
jgi:hypothetical protein